MYHAWQNMGEIGSNFGGSYMTDPLLLTVNRNCPMRRFLRKKTSFGYFCWEMPRMNMGVSQERKCLLNIVSQKLISYDFCTSFVLHKVKKTFGGSKWKLIELTRVSRYLAYVTRPHDWRIRVARGKVKPLWGKIPNTSQACRKKPFGKGWKLQVLVTLCLLAWLSYAVWLSVSACGEGD